MRPLAAAFSRRLLAAGDLLCLHRSFILWRLHIEEGAGSKLPAAKAAASGRTPRPRCARRSRALVSKSIGFSAASILEEVTV